MEELKEYFPDIDDADIVNFFNACGGKTDTARAMLQNHLDWLLLNPPPSRKDCSNLLQYNLCHHHGEDRSGHPLLILIARNYHPDLKLSLDDVTKLLLFWIDQLYDAMISKNNNTTSFSMLIDLSEVGSESYNQEIVSHLRDIFKANFPNRVHQVLICPSSYWLSGLWSGVLKWLTSSEFRKRVHFLNGTDGLVKFVDAKYIPSTLGGCSSFIYDSAQIAQAPSILHRSVKYFDFVEESHLGDYNDEFIREGSFDEDNWNDSLFRSTFKDTCGRLTSHSTGFYSCDQTPHLFKSWATKRGHMIRNWKRRFFVVISTDSETVIRYYENEIPLFPFGKKLKGFIDLKGYDVQESEQDSKLIYICSKAAKSPGKDLMILADDENSKNNFIDALQMHISFRDLKKPTTYGSSKHESFCTIL